jgi:hypothetical protein
METKRSKKTAAPGRNSVNYAAQLMRAAVSARMDGSLDGSAGVIVICVGKNISIANITYGPEIDKLTDGQVAALLLKNTMHDMATVAGSFDGKLGTPEDPVEVAARSAMAVNN